jgi:hypothetical protein
VTRFRSDQECKAVIDFLSIAHNQFVLVPVLAFLMMLLVVAKMGSETPAGRYVRIKEGSEEIET